MHRHDLPDVGLHGVWLRDEDPGRVPHHPNGAPGVENQHLRLILDVQPDRRAVVWEGSVQSSVRLSRLNMTYRGWWSV